MTNHRSVALLAALKGFVDAGHEIETVDCQTGMVTLRLNVEIPDVRLTLVWDAYKRQNSKIEAIREYRSLFNVGLADAKNAVEKFLAERGV